MAPNPSVRIVTDTTATLPAEYLTAHHVEAVPQVINFGDESFLEEVTLSYAEFIQRLVKSPQLPQTAAPPPGELVRAYSRQLKQAQTVLSIHPSADVSGTIRSAVTAIESSFSGADIRVLDTRTVGADLAAMVQVAVAAAEESQPADEIMDRLQAMIPRSRTYFLPATLEYLQKGGRIGGASALIGSALQIKPILQLTDGRVGVLEKVRTRRRSLDRLAQLVVEQCPRSADAHLAVMHADDLATARELVSTLQTAIGHRDIPIFNLGASITTHVGPGAVAVGFFV